MTEIGRKDVNTHDIYIKFECHEYRIILPQPKPEPEPEPETQSKVVI